ncbi:MAG: hypothetical protein IKS48_00625 [Eubacterium sp.]|nr:hypothetical protein [Eubacterium sp.]
MQSLRRLYGGYLYPQAYLINVISGLMNTVQQPASEVAYTMVIPKEHYQKTGGLQSLSRSIISIGNPIIAAALMMFILGVAEVLMCILFGNRISKYHYSD